MKLSLVWRLHQCKPIWPSLIFVTEWQKTLPKTSLGKLLPIAKTHLSVKCKVSIWLTCRHSAAPCQIVLLGKIFCSHHPLIIRFNSDHDAIIREVARIIEGEDGIGSIRYVRDFEEEEGSLTGFGDTIVDVLELLKVEPTQRLRLLDAINTATEPPIYLCQVKDRELG